MECPTDIGKVLAHEGFTTGDDDHHLVRIDMRRDLGINDVQEIFCGHVGCLNGCDAVTSAMQTMHVTTKGRFPKELLQRMHLFEITPPQFLQPQRYFQSQLHPYPIIRHVGFLFGIGCYILFAISSLIKNHITPIIIIFLAVLEIHVQNVIYFFETIVEDPTFFRCCFA